MLTLLAVVLTLLPRSVDWRPDYETARVEAREKNRLLLLHFTVAGRPLCRAMEEETFSHLGVVRAAAERFVSVRVDAEARPDLFEATIGGRGGLATCVVDAEGDVISALHGFAGPEAFLRFLERGEGAYAAVKAAREGLALRPGDPAALHALGEAYRAADSLRRADDCYRKVVERHPESAAAASSHERLARLRIMRGKNLEARKHLVEARRLDPAGHSTAADRLLLTEGLVLAVERKHAEAATLLRDALKRFPSAGESDHLRYALGFVLHQDGRDTAALEVFEAALKLHPDSSWVPAIREQIGHIRNPQPDHTH